MTIFQLFQRTIYPLLLDSSERVFKNYPLLVLLFFFNVNLYSQHYAIKSVELGDIEINRDFDSKVNYGLISNYKSAVDVVMSQILGKSAVYMDASRPESLLSNWVADVMLNTVVDLVGMLILFSVILVDCEVICQKEMWQ